MNTRTSRLRADMSQSTSSYPNAGTVRSSSSPRPIHALDRRGKKNGLRPAHFSLLIRVRLIAGKRPEGQAGAGARGGFQAKLYAGFASEPPDARPPADRQARRP